MRKGLELETFQKDIVQQTMTFQAPSQGDVNSLKQFKSTVSKASPLSNPLILWSPLDTPLVQEESLRPLVRVLGSSLDVTES